MEIYVELLLFTIFVLEVAYSFSLGHLVFKNTDSSGSRARNSMGISDKNSEFDAEQQFHSDLG